MREGIGAVRTRVRKVQASDLLRVGRILEEPTLD